VIDRTTARGCPRGHSLPAVDDLSHRGSPARSVDEASQLRPQPVIYLSLYLFLSLLDWRERRYSSDGDATSLASCFLFVFFFFSSNYVLETEEALELDDPTLRHDAQAITSLFIYLFIYYLFIVLPQDNNISGRAHPGASP
jgi:hypothetical protein